mmetsp:Transcript_1845/g.4313  ORF Transcript_1845/g.4313 Transcript_1845/m.4313 type:complete len:266 (-) Transcript_1845:110-907(-)
MPLAQLLPDGHRPRSRTGHSRVDAGGRVPHVPQRLIPHRARLDDHNKQALAEVRKRLLHSHDHTDLRGAVFLRHWKRALRFIIPLRDVGRVHVHRDERDPARVLPLAPPTNILLREAHRQALLLQALRVRLLALVPSAPDLRPRGSAPPRVLPPQGAVRARAVRAADSLPPPSGPLATQAHLRDVLGDQQLRATHPRAPSPAANHPDQPGRDAAHPAAPAGRATSWGASAGQPRYEHVAGGGGSAVHRAGTGAGRASQHPPLRVG